MQIFKIALVLALFASVASAAPRAPIAPEVLLLKDGTELPSTLLKKYPSEVLATALVRRYHRIHETERTTNPDFDFRSGTVIQMQFKSKFTASILKNGFLNQHQTGTSGGALNTNYRRLLEDTLMGLRIGGSNPQANELRPKYAYLNFWVGRPNQHVAHFIPQYGDVVAVFNESIKKRTTFTVDDSLDSNQGPNESDDENAAPTTVEVQTPLHTFAYCSETPLLRLEHPNDGYWEAQIWGRLTVANVDYFLVNCPGLDRVSSETRAQLVQSGRPVYDCVKAEDGSHYHPSADHSPE